MRRPENFDEIEAFLDIFAEATSDTSKLVIETAWSNWLLDNTHLAGEGRG